MARRIPGIFVPTDINLASDLAIIEVGPWAELLYRRGLEHCKKLGRDGIIHKSEIGDFSRAIPQPGKQAHALVDAGLWVCHDQCWEVRSWSKWNLTMAEQAEQREAKRLAALRSHHNRGLHKSGPVKECPSCA